MIEDVLKFIFIIVEKEFFNNVVTKFIVIDLIKVSLAILKHIASDVVVNTC